LPRRPGAFADDLTGTLNAVFDIERASFQAETGPRKSSRVVVRSEPRPLILKIDGRDALELAVRFLCRWDREGTYLAVDSSTWSVLAHGVGEPPLRYEFESVPRSRAVPSAHLHVHAHRDEILYQLVRAERGKAQSRSKLITGELRGAVPRLADLHLPLGGPRMRPCLEDLYTFLITEFSVDAKIGHLDVLDEKRAEWRRLQIRTAVRDAPGEAARVLGELATQSQAHPTGRLLTALTISDATRGTCRMFAWCTWRP
jgi:hypothetical protein